MRILPLLLLLAACAVPDAVLVHPELSVAHQDATCSGCHRDGLAEPPAEDCAGCHVAPEGHVDAPCEDCHDGRDWSGDAFDHPVSLPHSQDVAACEACHQGGAGGPVECLDCHAHRHQAVDPPHMALGVPGYEFKTRACLRCHPDARVH